MNTIFERLPTRYRVHYILAGGLFGFLFYMLIVLGSTYIVGITESRFEHCFSEMIFLEGTEDCMGTVSGLVFSSAYVLTFGPLILLSSILPHNWDENIAFLLSTLSYVVLGAICIGALRLKKGVLVFLFLILAISVPFLLLLTLGR